MTIDRHKWLSKNWPACESAYSCLSNIPTSSQTRSIIAGLKPNSGVGFSPCVPL